MRKGGRGKMKKMDVWHRHPNWITTWNVSDMCTNLVNKYTETEKIANIYTRNANGHQHFL